MRKRTHILRLRNIQVKYMKAGKLMDTNDIAKTIRYFRKQSGLSQLQLAQLAGIGKTAVFDIEKGKKTVRLDTVLKILEVLNIQIFLQTPFRQEDKS